MDKNEILIGFSKTKRRIDGPFEICGSRAVLVSLAQQILHLCDKARFSYGWIHLLPCDTYNPNMRNNSPIGWDVEGDRIDERNNAD